MLKNFIFVYFFVFVWGGALPDRLQVFDFSRFIESSEKCGNA
jgi:hypothetical protein